MESFVFASPLLSRPLTVRQVSSGIIGFKLYPGALLLVNHFERNRMSPSTRVIELGAGICGLPSLALSGAGCEVLATDIPDIVHGLSNNLTSNASLSRCMPLTWGDAAELRAVRDTLKARATTPHAPPCSMHELPVPGALDTGDSFVGLLDVIVAADVVYHEPLIEPLLQTLVALTDPPVRSADPTERQCTCAPPRIVMSYVQVR